MNANDICFILKTGPRFRNLRLKAPLRHQNPELRVNLLTPITTEISLVNIL